MESAEILFIESLVAMAVLGILVFFLIRRNIIQLKTDKFWNWSRTLIILAFLSNLLAYAMVAFTYILDNFLNWSFMPLQALGGEWLLFTGLTVGFGLAFVLYINEWDSVVLAPIFFVIGSYIFLKITDVDLFFAVFLNAFTAISAAGMLEAAIRLRDNDALGIAIFYILNDVSIIFQYFQIWVPQQIIFYIGMAFGLYYAFGRLHPYATKHEPIREFHGDSGYTEVEI